MWKRVLALLLTVSVGGYVFADAWDLLPGPLTTAPAPAEPLPYPTVAQVKAQAPDVGGEPAAKAPRASEVSSLIEALANHERNTGQTSVVVSDPRTGEVIASLNPDRPAIPASNMKIVTSAAALEVLGPETTLPTVASLAGTTLYLVGGGDVLLAEGAGDPHATQGRAGLGDLATAAAQAMKDKGVGAINVVVDSSLFEGPQYFTDIEGADRGFIMELRPLAIDRGRASKGGYLPNPDLAAGEVFAEHLRAAGLEVSGVERGGRAPAAAVELARVNSAPVRELVGLLLTASDNSLAEVMGHLVGAAKATGSFEGAAKAIGEVMGAKFDMTGVVLGDASGLSMTNRLTASLLNNILLETWQCKECPLAALPAGLPVASLTGTLTHRFDGSDISGQVRAKTGTLVEAISLSGFMRTEAGYPLVFSVLLDHLEEGTAPDSRSLIDGFVEGLAHL